jgi:hypothetical protein
MSAISYENVKVRADLLDAQRGVWRHLGKAGTWFTGAERVAIVAESRNAHDCSLCREREAAVSPYAVDGEHEALAGAPLSSAAIDVIHRLVADPSRLSKRWFDDNIAAGLSAEEHVEIVSVVVLTVALDVFCRSLGVARHPLPEPQPGQPCRRRASNVVDGGAWVPMSKSRSPNIARALGSVPSSNAALFSLASAQYGNDAQLQNMAFERALTRPQIELVAARVSALAGCFY